MDNDPTKLTSFQPLNPVSSSSNFSFSRFFAFGRRKTSQVPRLPVTPEQVRKEPNQEASEAENETTAKSASEESTAHSKKDNLYAWLTESASGQQNVFQSQDLSREDRLTKSVSELPRNNKWRYRNVRTIIRRLSALTIDRSWHQTTGDFKHNFKQYWMPDEHCKECYECADKFNTFRRRHHCRVCGQIFCNRCCSQEVPGRVMGFAGDIRVCNYCHKIVQAYLNDDLDKDGLGDEWKVGYDHNYYFCDYGANSNSVNSAKPNFQLDDSQFRLKRSPSDISLGNSGVDRVVTPVQRSPFDAFGVAPSEANNIKQDYFLRELWRQISDPRIGLELQSHRFRMKTHHNCIIGSELVDWVAARAKASSRTQCVKLGQDLLDAGWISCVYTPDENLFKDEYTLYQPTKMAMAESEAALLASPSLIRDDVVISGGNNFVTDDDAEAPKWFKQLSHAVLQEDGEGSHSLSHSGTRFSSARLLDLDQVQSIIDEKKTDLSIQMKLTDPLNMDDITKSSFDHASKISLITNVPPVPLDHWTLVEVNQTSNKKKLSKLPSSTALNEDILHGVIFPRPTAVGGSLQEDDADDQVKDKTSERLALERLSSASQYHLHALLEQLLAQEQLQPEWEKIIMSFVLKVTEKVVPDVRREDDMDIRRYVWQTKVPGGLKGDSHFISGVVFTKNVSHKRMTTMFNQPKILMMSCAIEYQRVENKLASLDPLVLQEHAFLQNFVRRVLDLKPNIFLVEKSVARKAQEMLLSGGVTLVHNIKPQIMENISRCTGADILHKMEQITKPRLGTCQNFRLEKFTLHNGGTKSLMYFDGCACDLGCSIVLRGGNNETLVKVKRILKYLVNVSYHLKLETQFLMDEFAMPPCLDNLMPKSMLESDLNLIEHESDESSKHLTHELEAEKFHKTLQRILLSSSPFINYSMPYLLTHEGMLSSSRAFIADQIYWSLHLNEPKPKDDDHEHKYTSDNISSEVIMRSAHPFTDPSVLIQCVEDERMCTTLLNDFRARGGRIDLKMYHEFEERERVKMYGVATVHCEVTEVRQDDVEMKEIVKEVHPFERPPDPKFDCFDAYNHQKIAVLFSSYSSESNNSPKPCISPWAVFMEFYGRNDITLGGFLERYCFRPSYICPSHHCDVPMVNHVRYFAHSNSSLYIHMRNLESPIPGYDRTILTWSWCKLCKQVTPVVPLSWESWSLSFAKYLELRFYGHNYTRRISAEPCSHSLHHNHYQYFSFANMVASFKYRQIDLYEVIIPADSVVIGKQRNIDALMTEVNQISERVEGVLSVVFERIQKLKTDEHVFANVSRDLQIEEFVNEVQKEQCNTRDCLQVVKSKGDSLLAFSSTDAKNDSEDGAEKDLPINFTNDEVQVLMLDIGNKLFHLRKNICEFVEHWNAKLQDFVIQDRKREKVVARATSPAKPIVSEVTEFYPEDSTEMDLAKPVTVVKLALKEPITEVCLTNGTILRQTYFGNMPVSSDGGLVKEKSMGKVDDKKVDKLNDPRKQLGSPYMVIKTSLFDAQETTEELKSKQCKVDKNIDSDDRDRIDGYMKQVENLDHDFINDLSQTVEMAEDEINILSDYYKDDSLSPDSTTDSGPEEIQANHVTLKRRKTLPGYTEFPHVKEEDLEKIEYLTPNEVKAMQNARRSIRELKKKVSAPSSMQAFQFQNSHLSPEKKPKKSNTLLKKLMSRDLLGSYNKGKGGNEKSKSRKKSEFRSSDEIRDPLRYENNDQNQSSQAPSKASSPTEDASESKFQKQKRLGHRRMRSAPQKTTRKHFIEMKSDLTPESPYICIDGDNLDFERERSQSEGPGQQQLSKMAEAVCRKDRLDSERDDPEVLQFEGMQFNYSAARSDDQNMKKKSKDLENIDNKLTMSGEVIIKNKGGGSVKMKKIISTFLPSVTFQPIPRPFPFHMHYMTQIGASSTIIINEQEPTSLIAFTLSCPKYQAHLKDIQDMMAGRKIPAYTLQSSTMISQPGTPLSPRKSIPHSPATPNNDIEKAEVFLRRNVSKQNPRPNSWAGSTEANEPYTSSPIPDAVFTSQSKHPLTPSNDFDDANDTDPLEESGSTKSNGESKKKDKFTIDSHIKLQFQSENVAKFYCSVYYAEQFRQLRELIFPEKEERYIQSLARCKFWKATGGKSGSSFSKSLDDRFVMKQMSRPEVQSFVDFAPRYFAYINKAIKEKRPTAMAKLLGVYRIGFNNPATNTTMRQDVLVTENLFYEKKVNKIFDLKGSVRGRYVQTAAKEDVRMDENLLEMISGSPLFIRPHSKAVLSKAIYNDTEFLSSNMVMDYSLLVGIDQTNHQLVVGIIDYIRTYTWDKRLETWVKSTGFLGGQGKMPTVVSPEVYRTRFTEAMQRYFLMVPDKWTGFGADLN